VTRSSVAVNPSTESTPKARPRSAKAPVSKPLSREKVAYLDEWIGYTNAIAEWCLRNAKTSFKANSLNDSLVWNSLASRMYATNCDPLTSEEIEANLVRIAKTLPHKKWNKSEAAGTKKRWLHVIDNAPAYGGLTAMVTRWINIDAENNIYSVALTNQSDPVPEVLANAVRKSGGQISIADRKQNFLARAEWLRDLAYGSSDCVVLSMDLWNVIAPVAFGVDDGPPVLLVNHSAHTYWSGGAIADLVLNVRASQLEIDWTSEFRGLPWCATLPIPLEMPKRFSASQMFSDEERANARKELGIPIDAVLLLTVGRSLKYKPTEERNFFSVAEEILAKIPNAHLIAVGPPEDEWWKNLKEKTDGRGRTVGLVGFDLRKYYAAADIYVEGFPMGSATALFEAGLHEIPCVLAPADCPTTFATDGIAIDDVITHPADRDEYIQEVIELIDNPSERMRNGKLIASCVERHHSAAGWAIHFKKLADTLPVRHKVSKPSPKSPPKEDVYYWTEFVATWTDFCGRYRIDPLDYCFRMALYMGVNPVMDSDLSRSCRSAKWVRSEGGSPLMLYWLIGKVLGILPQSKRLPLYDAVISSSRANGRFRKTFRLGEGSRSPLGVRMSVAS
jgi:glycosyltransferase involved in cell wall biosynthesis